MAKLLSVDSFYICLIDSLRLKLFTFLIRIASICGELLNSSTSVMERAATAFGARELLLLLSRLLLVWHTSPSFTKVVGCWRFLLDHNFVAIAIISSFCYLRIGRFGCEFFLGLNWIKFLTNGRNVLRRRRLSFSGVLWVLHILLNHLKSFIIFIKIQLSLVNSAVSDLFGLNFIDLNCSSLILILNIQILIHLFDLLIKANDHIFLRCHLSQTFILSFVIPRFHSLFRKWYRFTLVENYVLRFKF